MTPRCARCGGRLLLERGVGGDADALQCIACGRRPDAPTPPTLSPTPTYACPDCPQTFGSTLARRSHQKAHGGTYRTLRGPAPIVAQDDRGRVLA